MRKLKFFVSVMFLCFMASLVTVVLPVKGVSVYSVASYGNIDDKASVVLAAFPSVGASASCDGETFLASGSGMLDQIQMLLAKTAGTDMNFKCGVWEVGSLTSMPSGTTPDAVSQVYDSSGVATFTTVGAMTTFNFQFDGSFQILEGHYYYYGVYSEDWVGGDSQLKIGMDFSSSSYAGKWYEYYSSAWHDAGASAWDLCFNIQVTDAPLTFTPHLWTSGCLGTTNNNGSIVNEHDNWRVSVKADAGWRFDHFYYFGSNYNITVDDEGVDMVLNATGLWYTYTFQDVTADNRSYGLVFVPLHGMDAEGADAVLRIFITGAGTYSLSMSPPYHVGDELVLTAIPSPNASLLSFTRAYLPEVANLSNPYTFRIMRTAEVFGLTFSDVNGTVVNPTATPDTSVTTAITPYVNWLVPILLLLIPAFLLGGVCVWSGATALAPWAFVAGMNIGVFLGYAFLSAYIPLGLLIAILAVDAIIVTGKVVL